MGKETTHITKMGNITDKKMTESTQHEEEKHIIAPEEVNHSEKPAKIKRKHWFASKAFNDQYDYEGRDLGAIYSPKQTVFKVWAPTASEVVLNLYKYGSAAEAEEIKAADVPESHVLNRDVRGTWLAKIEKDLEGVYYTYTVTVDGKTIETGDPYAIAAGVNGVRSMVVDMNRTNPEGWCEDQRPEGILDHPVIYELHIQDFSHDPRCDVREEWRGKYMAFTENGTTLDGAGEFPTCMDYIKSLGVNYVHILPSFDYGSVDEDALEREQFNWGYDPMNYNVPEGSYATNARDGHVRIQEFKTMVQAMHNAGLGVIMDVVYNHTYNMDTCLNRMVPDYYYRMNEDGTYANGSACGNDTASERVMFRRYMADSVCFWAKEYHIDGFRFDLMGLHDTETMNYIRERLNALEDGENIMIYGEPWAAAKTAWENDAIGSVTDKIQLLDDKVAAFSDRTRDAIKGSVFKKLERGYANGRDSEVDGFVSDIQAAVCAWCGQGRDEGKMMPNAPSQVISYISSHDDLTLWDKLVISMKEAPDYTEKYEDVLQVNKMAAGIILTSLGTPFFLAGEEYGRTKMGCGNSFDKSPLLNQLDWQRASDFGDLVQYYRFLISLRKNLPLLDRKDAAASDLIEFEVRDDAVVCYTMSEAGKYWQQALIYYNPYNDAVDVDLPKGQWQLISDGVSVYDEKGVSEVSKTLSLKAKSVTILGIQ